jgi:hypothetical protein
MWWNVPMGAYEHAKFPCAIDRVMYADTEASLSLGPPISAVNPTKRVDAEIQPITHEIPEIGRSSSDVILRQLGVSIGMAIIDNLA